LHTRPPRPRADTCRPVRRRKERKEHSELDPVFWWAEGQAALEQDWQRGDFSTCVDNKFSCKAFGVEFDFDGIRAMQPPDKAAAMAKALSVAGDPNWITPMKAGRQLYMSDFASPTSADRVLIDHCRLGFVVSRAVLMEQKIHRRQGDIQVEEREWDIPTWFWQEFTTTGSSAVDWNRATFSGQGSTPEGLSAMKLTAVYFLQSSLPQGHSVGGPRTPDAAAKEQKGRPASGRQWTFANMEFMYPTLLGGFSRPQTSSGNQQLGCSRGIQSRR
jgi:hypothetical protein